MQGETKSMTADRSASSGAQRGYTGYKRSYSGDVVATSEHCAHCFEVLLAYFDGIEPPKPAFASDECPLFVTWKKRSLRQPTDQYKLRGCIGTLEPKHLVVAVGEYAMVSSLRDRRFVPIIFDEVELLKCSVNLLSSFERMQDWKDWTLGLHGLVVEFQHPVSHANSTATFLPDVPLHERWGQRQTIDSLIRKAGFHGPIDDEMRSSVRLTRYQASSSSLTYQEYVQLRGGRQQVPQDGSTVLLKSGSPKVAPFGETASVSTSARPAPTAQVAAGPVRRG